MHQALTLCLQIGIDPVEVKVQFNASPSANETQGDHPGRYHLPTAPEVALLMPRHIPVGSKRQIVCDMRNSSRSRLTFIPDHHQCYFPFMYSVLAPYGTNGWTHEMRSNDAGRMKITLPRWVRWQIMTRPTQFNHIVHSRKLFQQFLVDHWAIKETSALNWMKFNQHTIRADVYSGVQRSIAEGTVASSGATVLAKSFTGGERWYSNAFMDAMAICRVKGKPDLFLTKTLDVNCPEVRALLRDGESPYDRPDILVRVFELKRNKFMKLILGEGGRAGIFGKVKAHVAVVEFQKRGEKFDLI